MHLVSTEKPYFRYNPPGGLPAEAAQGQSVAAVPTVATPEAKGVAVKAQELVKRYGDLEVLKHLSLTIRPGEFIAIVGRSGCGKSTLLRLLAGLEQANGGTLHVRGELRTGICENTRVMFQDPRLLPWKNILQNVGIGLGGEWRKNALAVLEKVGLASRAADWPAVLSGGQRQRVALARALVHMPGLLLLDEPLGALDALTRIDMQRMIEKLWQAYGFTAILVTHDVAEAVSLADRVVLIEEGRITLDQQITLPRPRNPGSAEFAALSAKVLDRVLEH